MKRLLLTAAILSVAYCFEVGDYLTSEEDILDALSREEISFTEYYDLLELFRDKVELTGDDLDRLRAIPGVDRRWIEAIEEARENAGLFADRESFERWFPFDFERIRAFVFFEKRERRDMNGSVKLYTHGRFIEDATPTNNLTGGFGTKTIRVEARGIDDQRSPRLRRRSFSVKKSSWGLTLGSFDEGFGNGLVMGKAFHIAGAKRTNTGLKSLISPVDNLFNGAYFSGDFGRVGTGAALSIVDYDSVCAEVMASELSFSPTSEYRFGGVFALAGVSSPDRGTRFSQSAGSVFGKAVVLGSKLDLELGWTDNGGVGLSLSALSKLEGVRSIASFWSYSDGFFPLNGDGESDYRYTYIPLGESGVVHDSRVAGESGAKMKITVPVGERVSVDLDQSGWRTPSAGDWGISTKSALYFRGENNTRFRGEYSWEKRTLASGVRSKNSIRMTANIPLAKDFGLNGYLRVSRSNIGEATTDGLSVNAEIQSDLFEPMQLRLQLVRSKTNLASQDNGYWALRFRNYLRTGPISWLAEVRWALYSKTDKDDLTEFRITSSYYWR